MTERQLAIATGRLKQENNRHWTNQRVTWAQVCSWGDAKATAKNNAMSYVAGELSKSTVKHAVYEGGKRTGVVEECTDIHRGTDTVVKRSFITIDADYLVAEGDPTGQQFIAAVRDAGWEASVQASWSHKDDAARLRLLVLPSRDMTPDEYRKVARWCMIEIGIGYFDQTCDQPERFMFMPTANAQRWHFAGMPVDVEAACLDIDMMPQDTKSADRVAVPSYDGSPYESLSPEKQAWAARHVQTCVDRARVNLEVAVAWDEGVTDDRGRGWERIMRDWAWELARLTVAPWTALDPDGAEMIFESVTPAEMLALWPEKWDRALANAADEAVDQPPWYGFLDEVSDGTVAGGRISAVLATGRRPKHPPTELLPPDDGTWTENSQTILTGKGWTDVTGCQLLRQWNGEFYEHVGTHWSRLPSDHVKAVVGDVLDTAYFMVETKNGPEPRGWPDSPAKVSEMTAKIAERALLHSDTRTGAWFDCTDDGCPSGVDDGDRYISHANGILSMKTRVLLNHSAGFFNTDARTFDYDPHAPCPLWEKTIGEWYPDSEMARHAEEVLGYLVYGDNSLDKMFPFLGPKRSGKGTLMRVVDSMVSPGSYKTLSLDDLSDRFGTEDLIGLLVVHVSEAVATRDSRKIASLLKSISGQDGTMNVKRKGEKSVSVTWTVRFVFAGNHTLALEDPSGVIADRMAPIVQAPDTSFFGREDITLTQRLIEERPGIGARLLVAYDRLMERGKFILPELSQIEIDKMRGEAAPFNTWLADTVDEAGADEHVLLDVLLDLWWQAHGKVGPRGVQYTLRWLAGQLRDENKTVSRTRVAGVLAQRCIGIRLRDDVETGGLT